MFFVLLISNERIWNRTLRTRTTRTHKISTEVSGQLQLITQPIIAVMGRSVPITEVLDTSALGPRCIVHVFGTEASWVRTVRSVANEL